MASVQQGGQIDVLNNAVVYIMRDGKATPVEFSYPLEEDDVVVAESGAKFVIMVKGEPVLVDEPCPTCILLKDGEVKAVPVSPQVSLTPSSEELAVDDADIAALQQAILSGEDPTDIFEAAAAGNAQGSSIGGFVTIAYDYASTLAEAGYDTFFSPGSTPPTDDTTVILPLSGGQRIGLSTQEGDLSDGTYPVSVSGTLLLSASSLAVDAASVSVSSTSLAALLAELTAEVGSSNQSVTWTANSAGSSITGTAGGQVVMTITVSAVPSGRDALVTIDVQIDKPLDHIAGNTGGLVIVNGSDITINLPVQANDSAGNPMLVDANVGITIADGAPPSLAPVSFSHVETSGPFVSAPQPLNINTGSDELASVVYSDSSELQAVLAAITSNGQPTDFTVTGNEITVFLAGQPGSPVLSISLNQAADGQYFNEIRQYLPVDQTGGNTLTIPVTVDVTDKDGDSASEVFSVTFIDGAVAGGGDAIATGSFSVTEKDLDANPATNPEKASGEITLAKATDDLVPASLTLANQADLLSGLSSVTSGGKPVTFSTSASATGEITLTGQLANGTTVMTLTLTPSQDASGGVKIASELSLYAPLDHNSVAANPYVSYDTSSETWRFDTQLQLKDSDGDSLSAPIEIRYSITDGVAPALNITNATLTDPPTAQQPVVVTESLGLNIGSDQLDAVYWSVSPQAQAILDGITSNGYATSVTSTVGEVVRIQVYVDDPAAPNNGARVLNFIMNTNPSGSYSGTYTVVQAQAVDQAGTNPLVIPMGVVVRDDDNDTLSGTVTVTLNDGIDPNISAPDSSLTDPAAGGAPSQVQQTVTISNGSDRIQSVYWLDEGTLASQLGALTSNGYSTRFSPNPLTGEPREIKVLVDDPASPDNGKTVLTLTLNYTASGQFDGTYTVTQSLPIDEPASNQLQLDLGIEVKDTDGDTAKTSVTVSINDGQIGAGRGNETLPAMTEKDLAPDTYPEVVSDSFIIAAATDRLIPGSITLAPGDLTALIQELDSELTSGGQA